MYQFIITRKRNYFKCIKLNVAMYGIENFVSWRWHLPLKMESLWKLTTI